MSEDQVDFETSVSAEITETGIKAAAKSRAISSFDRLIGSVADMGAAYFEGISARRRAITSGELAIIEAAAEFGVRRLGEDEAFAESAFRKLYAKAARAQINKEGVVAEAIEDLRNDPPSEDQAMNGPAELSAEFIDRFEAYSETASSDELRQRWGRVLASEIRFPGTFSAKCLRVVDELETRTAQLFSKVCERRLGHTIPRFMTYDFDFEDLNSLSDAGLVNISDLFGPVRNLDEVTDGQGRKLRFAAGDEFGLALLVDSGAIDALIKKEILSAGPAISVHVITDVGRAICSILPMSEEIGVRSTVSRMREISGSDDIYVCRLKGPNWEVLP